VTDLLIRYALEPAPEVNDKRTWASLYPKELIKALVKSLAYVPYYQDIENANMTETEKEEREAKLRQFFGCKRCGYCHSKGKRVSALLNYIISHFL
jgi:hypothetical protein